MNGKFERKLSQLAFGDLSPSEAKRLEKEAEKDPEARRALIHYKEMREGLRSLADVPEDQFSKERLRDAILKEGLKPAPYRPASNRSWLWMPVAACALGFGVMFVRHTIENGRIQPEILVSAKSMKPTPLVQIKQPVLVAANSPRDFKGLVVPALSKTRNISVANSRHGNRHRLEPNEVDHGIFAESNLGGGEYDDMLGPDLNDDAPAPPAIHQATVATVASTGPIVFIDQDKDTETGAQKATEVGSASNVLIGG